MSHESSWKNNSHFPWPKAEDHLLVSWLYILISECAYFLSSAFLGCFLIDYYQTLHDSIIHYVIMNVQAQVKFIALLRYYR